MSDAVLITLITVVGTTLVALGGGVRWSVKTAIEIWDKALGKRDTEIAELRKVRDDSLVQAVSDLTKAVGEISVKVDLLLDEWKGQP